MLRGAIIVTVLAYLALVIHEDQSGYDAPSPGELWARAMAGLCGELPTLCRATDRAWSAALDESGEWLRRTAGRLGVSALRPPSEPTVEGVAFDGHPATAILRVRDELRRVNKGRE